MKKLFLFLFIFFSISVSASCLEIAGAQFEAVDKRIFLVSKAGINVGTLSVDLGYDYEGVPDFREMKSPQFRFFTPKICDQSPNEQFLLNGKLVKAHIIKVFK